MGEDEDYKYDVFISYNHGNKKIATWVEHIFFPHFVFCLEESLGRPAQVYFDKKDINPGDKWKSDLRHALAHTRLLVPIWSIKYFLSKYCGAEFAVMLHREKELRYWEDGQKGGLIVPVQLWGEISHFPEVARQIQFLECRHYGNLRTGSPRLEEFEDYISQWVPNLAQKIRCAPVCDSAWDKSHWFDEPINKAENSQMLWPPRAREKYFIPSIGGGKGKQWVKS